MRDRLRKHEPVTVPRKIDPPRERESSQRSTANAAERDADAIADGQHTGTSARVRPESELPAGAKLDGGRPLDDATRARFEKQLGVDFSKVRIHDDHDAHSTASALGARAFTVGEHISFAAGHLDAARGEQLLAHELAHVAQQKSAGVATVQCKADEQAGGSLVQRLAKAAVDEIDGGQSFRVLIQVLSVARNNHVLKELADELRHKAHPIHGNYLDAVIRKIHTEGSKETRDLIAALLGREAGVQQEVSARVTRMSTHEKLVEAARLGAPDIPGEVVEQLVAMLPWLVGFWAASHLIGVGEIADLLGVAFLGKAAADAVRDLLDYYELAKTAQNEADLRAAGHDLAQAVAILGIAGLFALLAAAKNKLGGKKKAGGGGGGGGSDEGAAKGGKREATTETQKSDTSKSESGKKEAAKEEESKATKSEPKASERETEGGSEGLSDKPNPIELFEKTARFKGDQAAKAKFFERGAAVLKALMGWTAELMGPAEDGSLIYRGEKQLKALVITPDGRVFTGVWGKDILFSFVNGKFLLRVDWKAPGLKEYK